MFHKWLYGHKKKTGIVGYDGLGNLWGCTVCKSKGGQ